MLAQHVLGPKGAKLSREHMYPGLSSEQAKTALERFGANALPEKAARPVWRRLVSQLQNWLIYLLLLALVVDLLAWVLAGRRGVPLEALAIFGVIVLNAALGVLQEFRSERALLELERLAAPRAWVLRDGSFEHLDARELVPGDIVRLEAGDRVPADGVARVSEALRLDESVLTGESVPVDAEPGDELSSGTLVVHGSATLEVLRTGSQSSMGKLATTLGSIDTTKTPLEQRVDELGAGIARVVGIICALMVVAGFALHGFSHPLPILMFAAAFGVAVVPEGMPAMMTLALAFGVQRMARRMAVVRRLAAVEALGSVTVIATDKTGTLTQNQLVVEELLPAAERDSDALLAMALANDADPDSGAGDPLELALMAHARRRGSDVSALKRAYPRISSRGFDSQWRCMRVTVQAPWGDSLGLLKGAPEALLGRCALEPSERERWLAQAEALAGRGLKVLALARGAATDEQGLTFLGLVSLWDPPRAEARGAVLAARRAGVRVIMVSGDHPATARAIADAVGLADTAVVQGDELPSSDPELDRVLEHSHVFARMRPEHKLRLIERLQAMGEVVAMTGDGLNDAPALKRADIGVAMGARGSEVAREVADLVLLDDNFATIVAAIEEGRSIYQNVQSFVRFSFSSNVALMLLVFGAAVGSLLHGLRAPGGGLLLPLSALQILWINFLGDGPPALAMALDASRSALLEAPRARHAPLLDAAAWRFIVADGIVKGGLGLALLVVLPWLGADLAETATAAFLYEGIAKLLSMFPARRLHGRLRPNAWIYAATAASALLQLATVAVPPLRKIMGVVELHGYQLLAVTIALLTTLGVGEAFIALAPVWGWGPKRRERETEAAEAFQE